MIYVIYVLKTKFEECSKDARRLHMLVNNLTTKQAETNWPPHKSEEDLANDFADFFQAKIDKIRQALNGKPQYKPTKEDVPYFKSFAPMMEEQVYKVVLSLKNKSCELDPIPTNILKIMILVLCPPMTKIVNISLTQGEFHHQWKTAVVRPLIKKLGLDLIHANFRPVSNLSFISKVIE